MSFAQNGPKEAARELVRRTLNRLTRPFGEDVIRDVWVEIRAEPSLRREYDSLYAVHGLSINQLIPQTTREETNLIAGRRVKTFGLPVETYTKLLPRR